MGNGTWMGGGMLLFWIILIVIVVVFIKVMTDRGSGLTGQRKNPIEILKERYPRGEIDEEEFKKRKRELEK